MKKRIICLTGLGTLVVCTWLVYAAEPKLFRPHGLPAGSGLEVLPQGAVVHLQFNNLYQTLVNLESLAKAVVPAKAVPPDAQPLAQMDHPLLTLLGMKFLNEPLTPDSLARNLGLNAEKPVSVTLYPGDPRKLFILTLPLADGEAFAQFLRNVVRPKSMGEVSLGGKPAVRIEVVTPKFSTDLYAVCTEHELFLCGDRSLALALYNNPTSERLAQDGFMRKIIHRDDHSDISFTFNPAIIKPFLLQAQALHSLAVPMLHAQRERLLKNLPPQVKERIQMQFQRQLGVKDLDQFADYAECFILATYETLCDVLGKELLAFEGLSVATRLDPAFPQLTLFVYSHDFQPDQYTRPIPLEEVRQAMTWLGKDFNDISVSGRRPQVKPCPFAIAWIKQAQNLMAARGLKSKFVDGLEKMVETQPLTQPLTTKAPWVLTTSAPLNAPPAIGQFHSLEAYGQALAQNFSFSINKKVKLVPGPSTDFLAEYFKEETRTLNRQQEMGVNFAKELTGRTPWLDRVSRFHSEPLKDQVMKFTLENAYLTHGGIFGYDQHEFINRRIFLARSVDGYVVYHQNAKNVAWLGRLPEPSGSLSPAMAKLLDRVPKGANYFHAHRVLQGLPQVVDWLASVENLAQSDLRDYLAKAGEIVKQTASIEEAKGRLASLKIPALVYSLNRDAQSGELYCLLPGNIAFPRGKVIPLVKGLLTDYAAKADRVGGGLIYTRVGPEVYEVSVVQSTEGVTALISSVANAIIDNYLTNPEKRRDVMQTVMAKKDRDPERFDEILLRNPRWEFLPGPKQHKPAKVAGPIRPRDPQAPANLVNLSAYYNAALTQSWHAGGMPNNTLKSLPPGVQEFGGTKFDVRGIVQLSGKSALNQLDVRFPKEVKAIKVGHKGGQLHFLHATSWPAPDGTTVGCYVVHYANGQSAEIPIVYGQDVRDWWTQNAEAQAGDKLQVAWTGKNTASIDNPPPVRLFKSCWKNPQPDNAIQSIDYRTAMSDSAPFLIAITVD